MQQNPNGLIVTEVKQEGVLLADHVPLAVAKMYASGKYMTYDSIFCPHLPPMLSYICLGKGLSMALS